MKSIQELSQKIKSKRQLLLLVSAISLIFIAVAVLSFIFGRLSVLSTQNEQDMLRVEYPSPVAKYDVKTGESNLVLKDTTGQYVASLSGTKYYTLDCSGVSRIKEENKTYFNSITEVENAGYEPASNCF